MKNFDSTRQPLHVLGRRILPCVTAALCAFAGQAGAQTAGAPVSSSPMIYPAKGQSARQQDRDKYECHDWARAQTGYDPTQASPPAPTNAINTASAPSRSNQTQEQLGGMVKGAMSGAAIGELTNHDAGRGAAVGALGGAVLQRVKQQQAAQQQQQQRQAAQQQDAQRQAAARNEQRATYERALSACMEGRGYTVK